MIKFYYGDYVKFKDHAPSEAVKAIVFHVFDEPAPLFVAEVSLFERKE